MANESEKATLWGTSMAARFSQFSEPTLPFAAPSAGSSAVGSPSVGAGSGLSMGPGAPAASTSAAPALPQDALPESSPMTPAVPIPPHPSPVVSSPPASQPGSQVSVTSAAPALDAPSLYVNRELSWLEFNARVLAEAEDSSVPLYERIKFLSIVTANLDEFFMVRVAGLKQQLSGEVEEPPPDGMMPQEQLAAVSARTHKLVDAQYRCWTDQLVPALAREGVMLVRPADLAPEELANLDAMFKNDIFPV